MQVFKTQIQFPLDRNLYGNIYILSLPRPLFLFGNMQLEL